MGHSFTVIGDVAELLKLAKVYIACAYRVAVGKDYIVFHTVVHFM
jgi:hypothetical protein